LADGTTSYGVRDLYGVLGLRPGAPPDEIRRAYFRLARKYHPDFHPGDEVAEQRMEDINLAYETLSDTAKRKEYDALIGMQVAPVAPNEAPPIVRDPYAVLGLSPESEQWVIREAFGVLAEKYFERARSDPAAQRAYREAKAAYDMVSTYERRRRYNAANGYPEPPPPDQEDENRRLSVLDGLGDLVWIVPTALVVLLFIAALTVVFPPYWLR
jgi:DnaJ-class molecular chaperone